MLRALKYLGIALGSIVILGILFRLVAVSEIENYNLGYKFNRFTGETTLYQRTGYVVNLPIVTSVYEIDTRPVQVCFNSSTRVLNCKLVQFNPEGFWDFMKLHGCNDYLVKHDENRRAVAGSLNDYLMNYAYSDNPGAYRFLHIVSEIKSDGTTTKTVEMGKPLPVGQSVPAQPPSAQPPAAADSAGK